MVRAVARVGVIAVTFACGLDPEVGKFERTCTADDRYGRPPGFDSNGPDPRCVSTGPAAESQCDRCENDKCCGSRFGCYDDAVCRCADQTFDECLESAAEEDAGEFESAAARCATDFEASGAAARARLDCRRRACRDECRPMTR